MGSVRAAALVLLPTATATATGAAPAAAQGTPERCRYLGGGDALLPFPNDAWTVRSSATATRRRLAIPAACALRTGSGRRIGPVPALRGGPRGARLRELVGLARRARLPTTRLHVVWDFTVGSERSIQRRLLRIRDDAFAKLGDVDLADGVVQGRAPAFSVTGVEDYAPERNPRILRRVTGTFQVPCYPISPGCAAGGRFNLAADGLPAPASRVGADGRLRLRGPARRRPGGRERRCDGRRAQPDLLRDELERHGQDDVPSTIEILRDLSKFPELTDRLQQGILAFTHLVRLLRHPAGLASAPLYGIRRITAYPFAGSAIIYWEPGGGLARVPRQPLTNTPAHLGVDPHADPRHTVAARAQKSAFLTPGGQVVDVCGGGPCQAAKDPARP